MRKKGFYYLIGIAVAVVAPLLLGLAGGLWVHTLALAGIFSIVTLSLNLILGYTGQLSAAQLAFFGIGAYTSALLMIHFGLNFWAAMLAGGLLVVVLALFMGYIALRLRGIYFAICTMAFLMLTFNLMQNLEITRGPRGLFPIPPPSIGGFVIEPTNRLAWVYLVFAFVLLTVFIIDRIINSRVGRAFIAIREDEDLAKSSGINTTAYKTLSFCISAFFAGIAGVLYASYMGVMTPVDCAFLPALVVIAGLVIGGLGTMPGPIVGTLFVYFLPEVLRPIKDYYYLLFGFIVLLVILFAPEGIMGLIKPLQNWLKARGSRKEVRV